MKSVCIKFYANVCGTFAQALHSDFMLCYILSTFSLFHYE
jgi:hypothetical protein